MSSDDLPYGERVICVDPRSDWYLQVGRIQGKNRDNVGVAYPGDPKEPAAGRWHPKRLVRPVAEAARGAEPYIDGFKVRNGRVRRDIDVVARPGGARRHFILTGPNGSGKTSILQALARELGAASDPGDDAPRVEPLPRSPAEGTAAARWLGHFVFTWLPAERPFRPHVVAGPAGLDWDNAAKDGPLGRYLPQHLVNRRTQQALAREDGRGEVADAIAAELAGFTAVLRRITRDAEAGFVIDRTTFDVRITLSGGREMPFRHLPAGWASILSFWAELTLREEAWRVAHGRTDRPLGVAVIDEIETHLHLRLQEEVLPFLTELFPNWQFIVATHSPVVLTSVPDAVVFDLGREDGDSSEEMRGIPYGALMTGWFGLDDEYDAQTTRDLAEYQALLEDIRADANRREELRTFLLRRSASLARQVWMMEHLERSGRAGRG